MSAAHAHTHPIANAELSGDPTHTGDVRDAFERELVSRFRNLRGRIRRQVGYETDAFGLTANQDDEDAPQVYDLPTREGKVSAFERDLRRWVDEGVLEPVDQGTVANGGHWTASYLRASYGRAWEDATSRLQQAGADVDDVADLQVTLNHPLPRSQLQDIYTRAYRHLAEITREMVPTIRRELTKGLAEGVNPRKIADRLTEEIRGIEHTRAVTLARTAVIDSYSRSTLDRYERAGVGEVSLSGEIATADDARVCPVCEAVAGEVFPIQEMRSGSWTYEAAEEEPDSLGGSYPLRPPLHPRCRCAILPVVG